ncbi:hypothetical protein QBC40DRAFT_266526 [Triangularia verruculosa]|uniref:Nicotinamide-nucleotide adenylyltransferase n=1 Tax=Triangularia verruculosa TaxID=2587418 RepID=A0AAN6XDP0_9PEZI|nr:hypothetical protein QBC40DRAFT_266526 [Triangularia verruculosa]
MSSFLDESLTGGCQPMRPQLSSSARALTTFFTQALASFRATSSKFEVICTVPQSSVDTRENDGRPTLPRPLPPRTRPSTLVILDSSFNPPTRAHLRMATSAIPPQAQEPETSQPRQKDAEETGGRAEAARLLLLLSVNNADKAPKPALFHHRLLLMWAFAQDVQSFLKKEDKPEISVDIGLLTLPFFHEKSEAIDQAEFYRHGSKEGRMEQIMLVGYDTLIRVFNPKYYGPVMASESDGPLNTSIPTTKQEETKTPMQMALGPLFQRARLRVTMRTDDEWGGKDEQLRYLQSLICGDDNQGGAPGLGRIGGSKEWAGRIEMVEGRQAGSEVISSTYARAAAKDGDEERLERMVSDRVRCWIEEESLYQE